jgi:hypothetical protein
VLSALTGMGAEVVVAGLKLGTLEGVSTLTAFNKALWNLPGGLDDLCAVSITL